VEIPGFRGQELTSVGENADVSKLGAGRVRATYEFIKANRDEYNVQAMCRVLGVAPSGYYAWLAHPVSNRAQEDARLLRLVRASFTASHGIYGAPRVFLDLREAGETCSKHRVARLMRENGLRALHGYRMRRWAVGKPSVLIPNLLQRHFTATRRNKAWVTDITYIRTWQGWLYLAVVMDLFSRKVVGWSTGPTIHRELVLDAVLMAVRRRRPRGTLIHSDQGTQYGSDAWRRFCRSNRLEPSMSRKGNCWDNAVAESFFGSLKKERVKKQIYKNREMATNDVADYIVRFYNRTRRHSHLGGMSPEQFEAAQKHR
jgi:putative transposase